MAQFTLTIREIVENKVDIFNFDYPIFEESYRVVLENKIINHFYFREIEFETVGKFIFKLKEKLNLIMPYYNEMYKTTKLDMEILDNYRITETYTRDVSNNDTINSNTVNKFSDSPQSRVDLKEAGFLTDLTDIDNTMTNENTNHETWIRNMNGSIGIATDAQHVMEYRRALINVDNMIMEELQELFMGVF